MSERGFTKQQVAHMITEILILSSNGTEFILEEELTDSQSLNFLIGILTSAKCPFSSVTLGKLYGENPEDFNEFLSIVFELNKNITKFTINCLNFFDTDFTKTLSKISNKGVVTDLSLAVQDFNLKNSFDFFNLNLESLFKRLELNTSITNFSINMPTRFNYNINESFLDFIKKNKTIKHLKFQNYSMNLDFLRLSDSIETLDLSGDILFDEEEFKALGRGLSLSPIIDLPTSISRIKTLILKDIYIDKPEDVNQLVSILNSNCNITKLDLSGSNIKDSLTAFCDLMKTNTSLKGTHYQ